MEMIMLPFEKSEDEKAKESSTSEVLFETFEDQTVEEFSRQRTSINSKTFLVIIDYRFHSSGELL